MTDAPTAAPPTAKPVVKIDTAQQLMNVQREIERFELWQDHLQGRGMCLGDINEHTLACFKATEKTLLLLMEFEHQFVQMVRREREASRARRTSSDRYGTSRRAPST